jgi:hypothetical protein
LNFVPVVHAQRIARRVDVLPLRRRILMIIVTAETHRASGGQSSVVSFQSQFTPEAGISSVTWIARLRSQRATVKPKKRAGRECFHCKQWVEPGEAHDCWTTTEAALTEDLSEDLRDAWERIRETAVEFGDQRIYASHSSIMFSRTACYFFVRPRPNRLELCIFLGRSIKARQVKKVIPSSRRKLAHIVYIHHRDEVEAPITDWLREAYEKSDELSYQSKRQRSAAASRRRPPRRTRSRRPRS